MGLRSAIKAWWKRVTNRTEKLLSLLPDVEELEGYARAFANAVESLGDRVQVLGSRGLMILDVARKFVLMAQTELPVEGAGADKLAAVETKLAAWYGKVDGSLDAFNAAWPVLKLFVGGLVKRLNDTYGKRW